MAGGAVKEGGKASAGNRKKSRRRHKRSSCPVRAAHCGLSPLPSTPVSSTTRWTSIPGGVRLPVGAIIVEGAACLVFRRSRAFFSRSSLLLSPFTKQLRELKQELGALRVAKVTGGAPNKLSKM